MSYLHLLSTGRCGTKFVSELLSRQGCNAFHENLRFKLPSLYRRRRLPDATLTDMSSRLGDIWMQNKKKFFQSRDTASVRSLDTFGEVVVGHGCAQDNKFVITSNTLTLLSHSIDDVLRGYKVDPKYMILFRSPFKTVHAILTVEGPDGFEHRPELFWRGAGEHLAAANIWKNTYRFALDFRKHLGGKRVRLLNLEKLVDVSDTRYATSVYRFIDNEPNLRVHVEFCDKVNRSIPRRRRATPTFRNSDRYVNPKFYFNDKQLDDIEKIVKPTARRLGIDLKAARDAYLVERITRT